MNHEQPKSHERSEITNEERALYTTGDPKLDFNIAKATANVVWEMGKMVYTWIKGESPLIIYVLNSTYQRESNHHVVTFLAKNVSPNGVYIEDITLNDSMQIAAFQDGGRAERESWGFSVARPDSEPNPSTPFTNTPLCPIYIAPFESFKISCAIESHGNKKVATINFIFSPLAGDQILKHSEAFRLRDR